jgi:hypothetical protein
MPEAGEKLAALTVSFKVIEFPIDEDAQTLLFRD